MKSMTYAEAGVDIPAGNAVKRQIGKLVSSTYNKHVVGGFGHFGGLFDVAFLKDYREPVMVSSVDGVGTKLKIAFETGIHNTVGRDLVNHCVNDILVLGAKPLFFLDYIAAGGIASEMVLQIVEGMSQGCREAGMVLIGGETAQMPDFYKSGEYDLAGTIIGVVDKGAILDGSKIVAGDIVIGLKSDGLHTNGYSLARRIVSEAAGKKYSDIFSESGRTFGQELLRPHVSYLSIRSLMERNLLHGCAHITGGGFVDNVNRVLPKTVDAAINATCWAPDPIFSFLQKTGNVEPFEMYRTFNMGIGMVIVAGKNHVDSIMRSPEVSTFDPLIIGEIKAGTGVVQMQF